MKKGAWIDFSLWLAATELVGILSGCLAGRGCVCGCGRDGKRQYHEGGKRG